MRVGRWALRVTLGGCLIMMVVRGIFVVGVLAAVAGTGAGCAHEGGAAKGPKEGEQTAALNRWLRDVDVSVPPTTYRVEPPDSIKVVAPQVKEIDGTQAKLRPDGKIGLNLVGELTVAGLTPSEIAEEITQKLDKFYRKGSVHVSVEVTAFESKKFYIFGVVNSPGVKTYTGRDTVVKALADAGFNDDSWPEKVVLIRPSEDVNVKQRVTIDVKQMYREGKADQNFLIEEGDLIYVPPNPLAEFRMTVNDWLGPIVPATDLALMATTGF